MFFLVLDIPPWWTKIVSGFLLIQLIMISFDDRVQKLTRCYPPSKLFLAKVPI